VRKLQTLSSPLQISLSKDCVFLEGGGDSTNARCNRMYKRGKYSASSGRPRRQNPAKGTPEPSYHNSLGQSSLANSFGDNYTYNVGGSDTLDSLDSLSYQPDLNPPSEDSSYVSSSLSNWNESNAMEEV
jgi:hypothetical protein